MERRKDLGRALTESDNSSGSGVMNIVKKRNWRWRKQLEDHCSLRVDLW